MHDYDLCVHCFRSLIHNVTKNLAEHGEKLDDTTKADVQSAIDDAKAVEASADVEVIKSKVTALSTAAMKIGQAMYGKKGADGSSSPAGAAEDATYDEKEKKAEEKK